jgi:single-strand DNA-binding protein
MIMGRLRCDFTAVIDLQVAAPPNIRKSNMNKISATGRLAADAEVRFTSGGDPVASFRLASDVGFGEKKSTNWFACQIWGKRGEALAPHLIKGSPVTVFGTLTLREWTTKEGAKQLSPDVRVDEIELQGGKKESAPAPRNAQGAQPRQSEGFDSEDIPF